MENTRKLNSSNLLERVDSVLSPVLPAAGSIVTGLSGGVDSVVLLHLLHQLSPKYSWRLSALHVHHGISPHADAWAALCTDLCKQHNIPLQIEHVDIGPLRGMGVEAAARKLRHQALARQPVDIVALAHHQDDQAETLLLQLLRGAGVRGASAMPTVKHRADSPLLVRPLLNAQRSELVTYAQQHQLQWVEDESNADDTYPRNFLRHRVLPVLEQKFPAYRDTLARSARHFAEAGELLDDLARLDAADLFPSDKTTSHSTRLPKYGDQVHPQGVRRGCKGLKPRQHTQAGYPAGGRGGRGEGDVFLLEISHLQSLSPPRAKNLLRYYLHRCGAPLPQAVQLEDMLQQVCNARQDAEVCITYADWQVRRYQGRVYVMHALGEFDPNFVLHWNGETELDWLPLGTQLQFHQIQGNGISLAKLQRAPVTLRLRQGGESLRPEPKAATRTLKNLLQEHPVPPWQRDRLPLLYCGDELVCVAGVAIAAGYQAEVSEMGIVPALI